jgi:hypothetical protein
LEEMMSSYLRCRGNTHTHTTVSDGDVPVEDAVAWYKSHGYHFVVITDHNRIADVSGLSTPEFLVIPGCEISLNAEDKPVHVNALNVQEMPKCTPGKTIAETLQKEVDATRDFGGVPQVNHPNWCWAFTHVQMAELTGCRLLEIYNAGTDCNNFGAGGMLSVEEIWDNLLTQGMRIYGVAADDSHHFAREFWGRVSPPGRGWVDVWVPELTAEAVLSALEEGRFYASSEISLSAYEVTNSRISLRIEQVDDFRYTTTFIGRGGKVLAEKYGTDVHYDIRGDEGYVRARIFSSNGGYAWTQPVFLE